MSHAEPLDILAVFAHPDDAELQCGGALAKAARAGRRVGILDLTRGEAGSTGTPELRAEEAGRAASVLGIHERRNAGLPDAALENTPQARAVIAAHLRALRPRTVVTHWTQGRHPDHRVAAELVYDACFLSGLRNFSPGDHPPHRPRSVVHATAYREDAPRPSFVVDITETLDAKLLALECYRSQFDGVASAGEVFPGGDRPLLEQIRAHAAWAGSLIRVKYGEPFWTRATVELEGLDGVRTPTF